MVRKMKEMRPTKRSSWDNILIQHQGALCRSAWCIPATRAILWSERSLVTSCRTASSISTVQISMYMNRSRITTKSFNLRISGMISMSIIISRQQTTWSLAMASKCRAHLLLTISWSCSCYLDPRLGFFELNHFSKSFCYSHDNKFWFFCSFVGYLHS